MNRKTFYSLLTIKNLHSGYLKIPSFFTHLEHHFFGDYCEEFDDFESDVPNFQSYLACRSLCGTELQYNGIPRTGKVPPKLFSFAPYFAISFIGTGIKPRSCGTIKVSMFLNRFESNSSCL